MVLLCYVLSIKIIYDSWNVKNVCINFFISFFFYGDCVCAQLYLQRLNYLSVSYKIAGDYDNITLAAITTFQVNVYKLFSVMLTCMYSSIYFSKLIWLQKSF